MNILGEIGICLAKVNMKYPIFIGRGSCQGYFHGTFKYSDGFQCIVEIRARPHHWIWDNK